MPKRPTRQRLPRRQSADTSVPTLAAPAAARSTYGPLDASRSHPLRGRQINRRVVVPASGFAPVGPRNALVGIAIPAHAGVHRRLSTNPNAVDAVLDRRAVLILIPRVAVHRRVPRKASIVRRIGRILFADALVDEVDARLIPGRRCRRRHESDRRHGTEHCEHHSSQTSHDFLLSDGRRVRPLPQGVVSNETCSAT